MNKQQEQIRKMSVRDRLMSIVCNDEIVDYLIKNSLVIPENAVVILDEEMEEFAEKLARSPQMQKVMNGLIKAWQKETAEKFAERLKSDVSEDNELHEALNKYLKRDYFEYIDERCKELMEGK